MNLKTRYEEIEDLKSYAGNLSEEDKEWLNKFAKEYIGASFDSKDNDNNLQKTKKQRKSCYDRNNARNRCIYTRALASGSLIYEEKFNEELLKKEDSENDIISKLDKDKLKKEFEPFLRKKKV